MLSHLFHTFAGFVGLCVLIVVSGPYKNVYVVCKVPASERSSCQALSNRTPPKKIEQQFTSISHRRWCWWIEAPNSSRPARHPTSPVLQRHPMEPETTQPAQRPTLGGQNSLFPKTSFKHGKIVGKTHGNSLVFDFRTLPWFWYGCFWQKHIQICEKKDLPLKDYSFVIKTVLIHPRVWCHVFILSDSHTEQWDGNSLSYFMWQ